MSVVMSKALHDAVKAGDLERVSQCLDQGADIESKDGYGRIPLMWAAFKGYTNVCSILLDRGADIEVRDSDGWTPLMHATWDGHAEVVALLLGRGADMEARDEDGWTPLIHAAFYCHTEVVSLLLERSADLDMQNNQGNTAEVIAQEKGRHAIVDLIRAERARRALLDDDFVCEVQASAS
jgi:ankyrin repeat protein